MKYITLFKNTTIIILSALLYIPHASAQDRSRSYDDDHVRVTDKGRGFSVSVADRNGTSREHAGLKAMEWACRVSLQRGFSHMGVEDFRTGTSSASVQTREAWTDYAQDVNGNVVNSGTRPAEYETVTRGTAILAVVMMSREAALGMTRAYQIIDANACRMIN